MNRTGLSCLRPATLAAVLTMAIAALAGGGCASDKSTISNAVAANGQLSPAIITDPTLSAYIQKVGDRVIAAAKTYDAAGKGPDTHKTGDSSWMFSDQMKFHLVNSKTVNAFTTGGEHMYIYTALFQMCADEDELAAVMAHEFAHVYSRHVQKGTNRQTGLQVLALGAAGAGYAAGGSANGASYAQTASGGATALGNFMGMSFTRKDEAEADEWGFKFYCRAGWDPDQFGGFFQKMIDAGYDTTPAMASDHPTLASRVANAKEYAAAWHQAHPTDTRQPDTADAARFASLKQEAVQVCAAMPDDTQTKQAQTLLASFNSCVAPKDQPEQAAVKQTLPVQSK